MVKLQKGFISLIALPIIFVGAWIVGTVTYHGVPSAQVQSK